MSYFPALINLENKRVLIVGGGKIASDKLERLLLFTKDITIIAKEFSPEVLKLAKDHCLLTLPRAYRSGDIDNFEIVIVAVDSILLQEKIFKESRKKRVLINSVDKKEFCDFLFPAFVKKGDLIVSFSTSGISPALSKELRKYFQEVIPDTIEEFLKKMKSLRATLPKGKERMKLFRKMAEEFIQNNFKDK
jgi:precorrin-2 dehydrogenase/sirohydrochlorin ferrochelatase